MCDEAAYRQSVGLTRMPYTVYRILLTLPNMPTSFSRSLRSLEADRFRWSLVGIVVGIVLLATWIAWFFLARVALYEVSDQARLEVGREPGGWEPG